jgi:hypothetical protein
LIERRAKAPLVAIEMLALPSVRWGNLAALTIFSMDVVHRHDAHAFVSACGSR